MARVAGGGMVPVVGARHVRCGAWRNRGGGRKPRAMGGPRKEKEKREGKEKKREKEKGGFPFLFS